MPRDVREGTAGPAPTGALALERERIRGLLGEGTIVLDTNMCIDHFLYAAWCSPGNSQRMLDGISALRKNRADDIVHDCLSEAMAQMRVKFPDIVFNWELDNILKRIRGRAGGDDVNLEPAEVDAMMDKVSESGLFRYSKDAAHWMSKCSQSMCMKVLEMYQRFPFSQETRKASQSLDARGKGHQPGDADTLILGAAADLAESGASVRLLTLDSHFTEFTPQIKRNLCVTIVDGNPYIMRGRELFESKDYAGAAECLLMGTDLNRKSMYGLSYLAKAYFHLGRDAEGRVVMKRIPLNMEEYSSVVSMAEIMMVAKQYTEAAYHFAEAANLKPGKAYPWQRRGKALVKLANSSKGQRRKKLERTASECFGRARVLGGGGSDGPN